MSRFALVLAIWPLMNCHSNLASTDGRDASRDMVAMSPRLDTASGSLSEVDATSPDRQVHGLDVADLDVTNGPDETRNGQYDSSASDTEPNRILDVARDVNVARDANVARDVNLPSLDTPPHQINSDTALSHPPSVLVGFGTETKGGLGGEVIKVTSLAPQGTGSLGAALAVTGPRIIVFEVGGVIDLEKGRFTVAQPFVTIAGETAPSPGITIIKGGLIVNTHDVIIRHIRVRMGDAGTTSAGSFEPDVTTTGADAHHIVFDHVSVSWGVDENLSVSGERYQGPEATSRKVTIANSIIAEGLHNSVHTKGAHSMGTLVHDYCTDIAVIGNLYIHNHERNPWFKGFATGVIVNNLIYNPGKWAIRLGFVDGEWAGQAISPKPPRVSIVGNIMRHGQNTQSGLAMVGSNSGSPGGYAFLYDNMAFDKGGSAVPITQSTVATLSEKPSWPVGLNARPAATTEAWVLEHAGARPKDRDATDLRLVEQVKNRKGAFIDSQSQVGGYPSPAPTRHTLEVPASDIDAWLANFAAQVE